jgi:hypothetical protein
MKKSSMVLLTIVAALTISSCAVQKATDNLNAQDPMYAEQMSDTTRQVQYNYYYRSHFWDDMYRFWFPRRYYQAINKPGFIPRHTRPPHSNPRNHRGRSSAPSSSRRGGFGHHGSTTTPVS